MARCCLSKSGEYSAAHVIHMGRMEKRPEYPQTYKRVPREGDVIIYNVKTSGDDRRTHKMEERGCVKITKIYPSIVTGVCYQIYPGRKQEIEKKITLPVNGFKSGNIVYVKAAKTVYCNTFEYEDWKLQDADRLEEQIARLHPYLKELTATV